MPKNTNQKWNVVTLVYMALLVSMNLVLTRVFVIDLGAYRVALGSVATILAGLWLGPVAGGTCGLVSDILGCLMKGYAVNPFITVAAILWGVIPALIRPMLKKGSRGTKIAFLSGSIAVTSIVSSLVFTTAGLVLMLGYSFYAIIPGRLIQFAIMTPIYCVITSFLYFSPLTAMIANTTASDSFLHDGHVRGPLG